MCVNRIQGRNPYSILRFAENLVWISGGNDLGFPFKGRVRANADAMDNQ